MKNFNLQLLRGTGSNNLKKTEDLVPKFYWKHHDVKPFLFADDESVHCFEPEDTIDKSLNKDSSDLRLLRQRSLVE